MKKAEKELTPIETWDSLAVTQIRKQLAPNGFKKIMNGKREVATSQFLSKDTVNRACLIGANIVRLYRENLREELQRRIEEAEASSTIHQRLIEGCPFWAFKAKKEYQKAYRHYRDKIGLLAIIQGQLDAVKPSTPKSQPKPKSKAETVLEQVKEMAAGLGGKK